MRKNLDGWLTRKFVSIVDRRLSIVDQYFSVADFCRSHFLLTFGRSTLSSTVDTLFDDQYFSIWSTLFCPVDTLFDGRHLARRSTLFYPIDTLIDVLFNDENFVRKAEKFTLFDCPVNKYKLVGFRTTI